VASGIAVGGARVLDRVAGLTALSEAPNTAAAADAAATAAALTALAGTGIAAATRRRGRQTNVGGGGFEPPTTGL
jgi:hypothetical protein